MSKVAKHKKEPRKTKSATRKSLQAKTRSKKSNPVLKLKKFIKKLENEIFQYKMVLGSLPGSVYWKNKKGEYLGRNKYSQEKMVSVNLENAPIGIEKDDIIGKTDYDLFPKETADRYRKHDLEVIRTSKEITIEEPVTLPNGKTLVQLSTKRPLLNSLGKIIGVIGNTVDITYQKEIENSLRKAKELAEEAVITKTNFIRNMEHDIRTPFNGIWGLSNYLFTKETDKTKKELLGDITNSAKQLLDYCNGILDFARNENQSLPVVEKRFNLKELIDKIILTEKPAAIFKKIELKSKLGKNIPEILIGDPYRLLRILINLVSNSIKFTEKGHVFIKVKKISLKKNICILQFIVEDTGIGISKDKQDFIFEKFGRVEPANTGKYAGLGLGLKIVKQFVNEMDGEINLKSIIGKETLFACTFPFKIPLSEEL